MEEKPLTAPPASANSAAPAHPPEPPQSEPENRPEPTIDEIVAQHLEEMGQLSEEQQHALPEETHLRVTEHAEQAGLAKWQITALVARFYPHGMRPHSKIHREVFEAALDHALHGRL